MTESTKIVGGLVNMRLKFSWSVIILQEGYWAGFMTTYCISALTALTGEILVITGRASMHIPSLGETLANVKKKKVVGEGTLNPNYRFLASPLSSQLLFLIKVVTGEHQESQGHNTPAGQHQLSHMFGMGKKGRASSLKNLNFKSWCETFHFFFALLQ